MYAHYQKAKKYRKYVAREVYSSTKYKVKSPPQSCKFPLNLFHRRHVAKKNHRNFYTIAYIHHEFSHETTQLSKITRLTSLSKFNRMENTRSSFECNFAVVPSCLAYSLTLLISQ